MLLYHYTSASRIASIYESGLNKGEVPLTQNTALNGVWLTTDSSPSGHGLGEARLFTEAERLSVFQRTGMMPPQDQHWDNKREVRITIKLPSNNPNLSRWSKWGRKNLERNWYDALSVAGGGEQKAKTWWVYWGVITPDMFVAVDHLAPSA
ncbi:hypothetical protein VH570_17525 [Sphingobium sp. HT1-2]|uniref:hypothetical protein n=1 Tax=Sphingobium sp. HT1-2 TaxID=3111640 RepID=UPI003C053DF7